MNERGGREDPDAVRSWDPALAPTWRAALRADWQRPRTPRQALRLAAWLYLAAVLPIPLIRIWAGFDAVAFPLLLASALPALLWVAPRQGEFRTWLLYAVGIYFFTQLRDAADETAIQASTGYVLDWEEWMFGGSTPSAWLQDRIGGADGNPGPLAYFSTLMHWSWFFFPHMAVVGTYFFARPMFFRVAAVMLGIFYAGVVMYYLIPTVPPWLAVEQGDTAGIVRIMHGVGPTIFGQGLWDDLFKIASEPNPRAAMPSLHFAASFQIVLIGWMLGSRRLAVSAFVYCLGLAFALMYLGEHYFVDILVGGLAAVAVFFIVERALGGPGLRFRARWPRWHWHPRRLTRPSTGGRHIWPDVGRGRQKRRTVRDYVRRPPRSTGGRTA